jgi:energy-coupling factor transport system permease protein
VHHLDPATKLACAGLIAVALLALRSWWALGLVALFLVVSFSVARLGLDPLYAPLRMARYFLLLCVVTQTLFYPGQADWQLGPLNVAWEGLLAGLGLASRLGLLIVASVLLTQTTSPTRLTGAMQGMSRPLGRWARPFEEMLLLLALAGRWVPVLLHEVTAVMRARQSRGLGQVSLGPRWPAQMADIAGQVFERAMTRAGVMAEAMECRSFRAGDRRATWRRANLGAADALALAATGAVLAAALWLQFWPPAW